MLLIFAILAGIGWMGVMGTQKTAGLIGGAQLVSDMVRQARSTALSNSAPVMLLIDADERTIAGVTQTPVAAISFDRVEDPEDTYYSTLGVEGEETPMGTSQGISGLGWVANHGDPASFPPSGGTIVGTLDKAVIGLRDAYPLRRRDGDGFALTIWIKPPGIGRSGVPDDIPLLMIDEQPGGTSGFDVFIPRPEPSGPPLSSLRTPPAFVGLKLERTVLEVQEQPPLGTIQVEHWMPVAWIRHGAAATDVTAVEGIMEVGDVPHPSVTNQEAASPILGDEWIELGLSYDGQQLSLYRSGRVIGNPVDVPPLPTPSRADPKQYVYWGRGWNGITAPPDGSMLAHVQIDEIRLFRTGTDSSQLLPSGVFVDKHYRLLCDLDGIRKFSRSDANDPWVAETGPLVLRDTSGEYTAEVAISATGNATISYTSPP